MNTKLRQIFEFIGWEIFRDITFERFHPKRLFLKHPCKKCIVQACCSKSCEKYFSYRYFIVPFEHAWAMRFCVISVYVSAFTVVAGLITWTYNVVLSNLGAG